MTGTGVGSTVTINTQARWPAACSWPRACVCVWCVWGCRYTSLSTPEGWYNTRPWHSPHRTLCPRPHSGPILHEATFKEPHLSYYSATVMLFWGPALSAARGAARYQGLWPGPCGCLLPQASPPCAHGRNPAGYNGFMYSGSEGDHGGMTIEARLLYWTATVAVPSL